jgi:starch-binding outer membrane protein SusE/F
LGNFHKKLAGIKSEKLKNNFMKKRTIYSIMAFLVTMTIFTASCTKENSAEKKLAPQVGTVQTNTIASDSAVITGLVISGEGFTEKGACWDTDSLPTTDKHKAVSNTTSTITSTYSVTLTGLQYATKYYVRTYAISGGTTVYGNGLTFTTLPVIPTLTTATITAITGNSAAGGGNVTVAGGADVTARGICFGKNHNPTVTDNKTSNGTGTGAFVSALTGLKGHTIYYVRAYATNSAGTGYGPEVTFTTLVDLPVVTTAAVTGITKIAAVSGGEVTYDGGGTVTARGLAWGATANPTVAGTTIDGGSGLGVFVSNLTGLTLFTTYHVRAYATNSAGTGYGNDIQFTTLANTRIWNIPGDYVAASYPGSTLADWSPDKSPQIKSTVTAPDNLEGYVYMSKTSNQWKFATQLNWDGPNYTAGTVPGTLSESGDNIASPAGYYKISVNAAPTPMTYTAVATVWGVIGDATPGGWGSQTDMTYIPTTQTFSIAVHLTNSAAFKFRGTSDWNINYGSTAADGTTLNAGGDNIPVTVTADYAITLDLSHPNAYTYSANRWGLIGDFNSWGGDQVMTWDATNHVFTATIVASAVGEFKFRANGAWTINLGGNLNALTAGGGNIPLTAAGNYTITLDPWGLKATVTKN